MRAEYSTRRARPTALAVGLGLGLALTIATDPVLAQRDTASTFTFHQYAPGLLARQSYRSPVRTPYVVAIWDLVVGPGMSSAEVTLPGGAVLEVRAGSGTMTTDSTHRELTQGMVITVAEGRRFALANKQRNLPLAVRATVVTRP